MTEADLETGTEATTAGKPWSLGRLMLWVVLPFYLLFLLANGTLFASANLAMLATNSVATTGYVYKVGHRTRRQFTAARYVATVSFTDQTSAQRMARVRMTSAYASGLKRGMAINIVYVPGNEKVAALSLAQATSTVVAGLLGPLILPFTFLVLVVVKKWRSPDGD